MARKKDFSKYIKNPCKFKGRYGGAEYVGQCFEFKDTVIPVGGCECKQEFIPHGKATYFKKYAISKDFKRLTPFTSEKRPKDCFEVVPCNGFFKNSASRGSRLYRKSMETNFTGCEQVEKYIIENGLLAPIPIHIDERMRIYSEIKRDEKIDGRANLREFYHSVTGSESNSVSLELLLEYFGNSLSQPENVLRSTIRKLFFSGEFREQRDLQITAFLIDHGFHGTEESQKLIARIFPKYPQNEYWSLQSRVYAIAKDQVPKKFDALKEAMAKLTANQKSAIEAVYFKNNDGLAHEEIAKKLGIKRSSLRSRIEGAKKKIIKALQEFYDEEKIHWAEANISKISG